MQPWLGTIRCNNACIVRSAPGLDSDLVCELPPGTRVAVDGEAVASGRGRLRLSKPCQGWVTGKFVERATEAWSAEGNASFFVDDKAQLTKKTPMGRQLDLFAGNGSVDKSFGSPAMMATDRVEMSLWMVRSLKRFNATLGEEAQARLLGGLGNQRQESGPQHQQQQSSLAASQSGSSAPSGSRTSQQKKRMQVLYTAGVEGTGHHGVMPLILHPAVHAHGNGVLVWWRSLREVLLKTPPAERKAKLRILLEGMSSSSKEEPRLIFEWCSYPFGEEHRDRWAAGCEDPGALAREEASGNPGNSVDLREFVELFQEYADVKVLVLHRGLVSSAWSHKEWDQSLLQHARVLALFSEYLTSVLRDLPPDTWRWVAYEDICAAHRQDALGEVAATLSAFLDLPREELERSFACFRPSSKDAAAEMPPEILREVTALEEKRSGSWFTSMFPEQQMLAGMAQRPLPAKAPGAGPNRPVPGPSPKVDPAANQNLTKMLSQLTKEQKQAWMDVQAAATASEAERAAAGKRLQALLSEDQLFLLRKALVMQQSADTASNAAIDPASFTCVHMWLGGCGFGSEVNNLISAAIYCDKHGLDCVVEDEGWNSGSLHEYLQAEPLILRRCPRAGRCQMLEIKRDKRVATKGWFAVRKHATGISFQEKSQYARKIWRYTPAVERSIKELNSELALPSAYVAVQIRRGDKVAGSRRESLKVTTADYARAAATHCDSPGSRCHTVAVCTDDLEAAEEFAAELRRRRPEISVRFRLRSKVPPQLRKGHWQAEFNSLQERERKAMTVEFLADVEVMRAARVLICTHSSNVGRLAALLRDDGTVSLDGEWTND